MRHWMLLFLLWGVQVVGAQLPTDFRSEQIYLNPQKHVFMPGDTINLEGMVTCFALDQSVPFSNYLYIECFDEADSVLLRQKVSCKEEGYFNTRIATDFLWPSGVYYLRAYTQLMRNFSSESFAQSSFLLAKEFPKKENRVYEARCTIIPSGGKLVAGNMQTVTVYLTDECTYPVSAAMLLVNESNDTVASVKTSASGMAMVNFIPQMGMKYRLKTEIDKVEYDFPLPEISTGIKVQCSLNGKRLNYQILNADTAKHHYSLYTFDRLNGLTALSRVLPQGIIQLDKQPSVLTLFLTDSKQNILSEATVASRYKMKYSLQAPDTLAIGDRIHYLLPQLPQGSKVMARIVKDNDLLASHGETELNYLSDFMSPLPFPVRMYGCDEAERNRSLQAWLSTAKFKRFNLKDAITKGTDMYVYAPEEVMAFTGWIEKKSLRPMANGQLVAYHTKNDFVYDVNLDVEGRFRIAVDDFWDGEEFFLQAITPKGKPDFANYHVDDETFPALINNRRFVVPVSRYADTEVIIRNTSDLQYTMGRDKVRNYMLPDVTVKARLKTEEAVQTNKFYSTNYADREKIEERAFGTLYDILRDMPGVVIRQVEASDEDEDEEAKGPIIESGWGASRPSKQSNKGLGKTWEIKTSRGESVMGDNNLPVLVDNVKFKKDDYDFILYMSAFEIESVELLRPWQALAYTSGAINGAILVKTRGYKERSPLPSKGAMYAPTGLCKQNGTYKPQPWIADSPGNYILIVDVFTPDGVHSFEHEFSVIPSETSV